MPRSKKETDERLAGIPRNTYFGAIPFAASQSGFAGGGDTYRIRRPVFTRDLLSSKLFLTAFFLNYAVVF